MLNIIWVAMILIGIIYGALNGTIGNVGNEAMNSAREAVNLCITMLSVMGFWCGLMEAANREGLILLLTRKIRPFVKWMFPKIPENHKCLKDISTNIVANILGLGWAATPAGLKAMEGLSDLEKERGNKTGIASNEMCTFLIINISSLQLVPVNIIAYRSQYGSVNPSSIIAPAIIATFCSTIVAIIFCKIKQRN